VVLAKDKGTLRSCLKHLRQNAPGKWPTGKTPPG